MDLIQTPPDSRHPSCPLLECTKLYFRFILPKCEGGLVIDFRSFYTTFHKISIVNCFELDQYIRYIPRSCLFFPWYDIQLSGLAIPCFLSLIFLFLSILIPSMSCSNIIHDWEMFLSFSCTGNLTNKSSLTIVQYRICAIYQP